MIFTTVDGERAENKSNVTSWLQSVFNFFAISLFSKVNTFIFLKESNHETRR